MQDKYRRQAAAIEAGILELEQRRDIIYRTIMLSCGVIDMRMYNNVLLYIIRGWSMDRIAVRMECSQATVTRDVQRFFAECNRFFEMATGTDIAS